MGGAGGGLGAGSEGWECNPQQVTVCCTLANSAHYTTSSSRILEQFTHQLYDYTHSTIKGLLPFNTEEHWESGVGVKVRQIFLNIILAHFKFCTFCVKDFSQLLLLVGSRVSGLLYSIITHLGSLNLCRHLESDAVYISTTKKTVR